jgi:murein tripeptide amidase MpaA
MIGLLLINLIAVGATTRRFDGDVVLRCEFDFSNDTHKHLYQSFVDSDRDEVDLWGRNDIRIPKKSIPRISAMLKEASISCTTMIKDVQALVDTENVESPARPGDTANPDPFFDAYRNLATIESWYTSRANDNRTITTFTQVNTSYEGRPIYLFKIATGAATKPAIFIEGGIHAREWISHATVAYLTSKLLNGSDPDAVACLNKFQWLIVPVVNPDGYVYTWGPDRMWRKTRRPNSGSSCVGTDPNRNWNDHWCQQGGSTNMCSDSYCGPNAFSERETQTAANVITNWQRNGTMRMFIDYHAYGQYWMAPYGWTGATPPDGAVQANIGNAATAAIRANSGLNYTYGTIYNVIYPASGSSADYAYTVGKVIYAYGVELRDKGTYGFQLPAAQIRPQGEEIWAATVAMMRQLP